MYPFYEFSISVYPELTISNSPTCVLMLLSPPHTLKSIPYHMWNNYIFCFLKIPPTHLHCSFHVNSHLGPIVSMEFGELPFWWTRTHPRARAVPHLKQKFLCLGPCKTSPHISLHLTVYYPLISFVMNW